MSLKYANLLTPIKIGKHILKNRMIAPQALPHYLQGPETYPAEPMITHVTNLAKNGAAIVTVGSWSDTDQRKAGGAASHFPMFDYTDPGIESYICQMVDAIHFYDSLASVCLLPMELPNFQPLSDPSIPFPFRFSTVGNPSKITREMMDAMISETVEKALYFKQMGFDMISLHMGYREYLHIGLSKFFSPLVNDRTDEYGGPVENRVRFPLEICRAVREACGPDFLIDLWVAGEEEEGGITVEDTVSLARLAEGVVDILQVRGGNINPVHPTGFNSSEKEPVTLHIAEAVKKSGVNILVAPAGGYGDPNLNEKYIAEGKADLISIGRAFICDPEYGKKVFEGRDDDIVPCQRCAKCHVPNMNGPWVVMCSGNPEIGFAHRIEKMVAIADKAKKVAVIGGGPAGMKAALVASQRGHKVTLYEKSAVLGGQLLHSDYSSFKWPLRQFKNYLVRQVKKSDVNVKLNTLAELGMIKEQGFDAVIIAIGSQANIPGIPGADSKIVCLPGYVYGNEGKLGNKVVVVGGGEIGTETALYLAECGHEITVLTRQSRLASDATPIHYREMFEERWGTNKNFEYIVEATTVAINNDGVTYADKEGNNHFIEADNVVLAAGRTPLHEKAIAFHESADFFAVIGDCKEPGNVQKCMRTAYAAATRI